MPMNFPYPNSGSIERLLKAAPIRIAANPQPIFPKRPYMLAVEGNRCETLGPESRTNRPGQ